MPNDNPQQHSSPPRPTEAASRVAERIEQTAEQAASSAVERVRQARDRTQSGLEQQRAEAAERIRRLGDALRSGSESLGAEDRTAQQLFDAVLTRVERVAQYVDGASMGGLAEDLHGLARRRPGVFFAGAFLAGLALGRFAKSSGHGSPHARRDETRRGGFATGDEFADSGYDADLREVERGQGSKS